MPLLGLRGSGAATAFGFGKAGTAWEPAGAYDSLATVTVGTAVSSITFAGIPTGYQHLQIRYIAKFTGTAINYTQPYIQFNSDATSSYDNHSLYGTGSSVGASYFAASGAYLTWVQDSNFVNTFAVGVVDILDYANVNKNKTIRTLGGFNNNTTGGSELVGLTSALWRKTNAISSMTIQGTANFATNSTFSLYGVK